MEKYIKTIHILAQNSKDAYTIKSKLDKASAIPNVFIAESSRILNKEDDLLWFALIDGLIETGCALELDWKDDLSFSDIESLLDKQHHAIIPDLIDNGYELEEALEDFGKQMQKTPYALLCLDIDSDSYVVTTCNLESLSYLQDLDLRIRKY